MCEGQREIGIILRSIPNSGPGEETIHYSHHFMIAEVKITNTKELDQLIRQLEALRPLLDTWDSDI